MKTAMYVMMFWLLTSCAQKLPKPDPSNLLFPHGTYQQKVRIQIIEPPRVFEMRGVVESRADRLKIVGLSAFGTTVFRIDEDLKTGRIEKEFYVDTLRRNEERFMFFYSLLKEMLLAPKGQLAFEKQGAKFLITNPDKNGLYRSVSISHPQVNLTIDTTGYDF